MCLPFLACANNDDNVDEKNVYVKFIASKISYIEDEVEHMYSKEQVLSLTPNDDLSSTATTQEKIENYFASNKSLVSIIAYLYNDSTSKFVFSQDYYNLYMWEQNAQGYVFTNGDFSMTFVESQGSYYMQDLYQDWLIRVYFEVQ